MWRRISGRTAAAAEIMIEKVGGKDQVNAWLRRSGFAHTTLQFDNLTFGHLLKQLDPEWKSLTPEEATGLTFATRCSSDRATRA